MLYFVLFFLILHPQNNIYKTIEQQIKQLCMDKKKLSPKQIFRTLAFHYHYDEKIPLDLLCQMVSSMYYPKDPNGQTRKRYKQLLIMLMKQYTQGQKYITQQQFCNYMLQMSKQKKDQYSQKLTHRIFHRYAEIDPDSKQKVICQGGFKQIAQFLKIRSDQAGEYFKSITDRKNQIDFEKFNGFMNSMIINN